MTRTLAVVLVRIFSLVLVLGVPIGLTALALRMGGLALIEWWAAGPGFEERGRFNVMIRLTSLFVMLIGTLGAASSAVGKVTIERDKGTWLPLLATPLDGREILGSKMKALARGLNGLAYLVAPLWLAGLACGSLQPLGLALAVVDLPLAVWLSIATGVWLGAGPAPPRRRPRRRA